MAGGVDTVLTRYQVDAVQAVDETRRLMQVERGLEGQGTSLTRSFQGLEEGLMGFRREQTQQQRTTGFLVREFGSIASAAGVGGQAMRDFTSLLVEGVAGGLGFGLALQAVMIGFSALNRIMEDAAKRNAEIIANARRAIDNTSASVTALGRAIDSISGEPLTETQKAVRQANDEMNEALLKQHRVIEDLKKDRGVLWNWFGVGDSDEIKRATADLDQIQADALDRVRRLEARGSGERRARAEQELRAEEIAEIRRDASNIARSNRKNADIIAIRRKLDADLKELDADRSITEEARETRRVHLERQADRDIEFSRQQHVTKMIDLRYQQGLAAEESMRKEIEEYAQVKLALQALEEEEKRRATQRLNEREALQLEQLGVAAAAYVQKSINAFSKLSQMRGSQLQQEKRGQELVMAGLDSLAAAVQDFTKGNIEALAKQAAVEGLVNLAKGFASLGLAALGVPGAGQAATAYFTAAAVDFSVAGVAAGLGAAMGGGGGGGGGAGAPADTGTGGGGSAPSAQEGGRGGPTFNVFFSGRALVTEAEVKRELADLMQEARDAGFVRN
jgi:hypothetical protein